MLRHKNTIIISEVKDFFTSSEKAINIIIGFMNSLMLSEKQLGIESNSNNEFKNVNKLLLLLLFPLFDIQIASTTLTMIQYNILSAAKRFADYKSMGALFRLAKAETLELTMADPKGCLWQKNLEVDNRNFNSISRNI